MDASARLPKRAEAVEDVRAGDLLVFLDGLTHVTRFVLDVDTQPQCVAAHDASKGEWVWLVYRAMSEVEDMPVGEGQRFETEEAKRAFLTGMERALGRVREIDAELRGEGE